jgi:hypothetical protein
MISKGMNDSQRAAPAAAGSGDAISADVRENSGERVTGDGVSAATSASADAAQSPLAAAGSSTRADWLRTVASCFSELLARPPLRLIVTGAVLLVIGGLLVPNSVWTLPVVILGALMVAIGWVGGRLDGRFAVEWGQAGTQLEFRARIAAASHERPLLPRAALRSRAHAGVPEVTPQDPQIIDATAHTVELDLAELEALIGAADTPESGNGPAASARAVQKLRVARNGEQSSEASATPWSER